MSIIRGKLYDPYLDKIHDYTHLRDLLHNEVLLPENAPVEFRDTQTLVGAMEKVERRYDARTGRKVRISLPNEKEFAVEDYVNMTRDFVTQTFVNEGMCAVFAIHEGKNNDPEKNNPHTHIVLTDRPVDSNGFCSKKNRDWNKVKLLRKWRKMWADK